MLIFFVCRMAYKAALIFFILLLSFPAKVGGMFSLMIHMSCYIDIALSKSHLEVCLVSQYLCLIFSNTARKNT